MTIFLLKKVKDLVNLFIEKGSNVYSGIRDVKS